MGSYLKGNGFIYLFIYRLQLFTWQCGEHTKLPCAVADLRAGPEKQGQLVLYE